MKNAGRRDVSKYLIGQIDERLNDVGCPVCELTKKSVNDYIDTLFYESVNDPGERRDFINGQGYCSKHLYMIEEHLDTHPDLGILGANILYSDLFELLEKAIDDENIKIGNGCKLCEIEKNAQKRYLEIFADYISDPSRLDKYKNSISMVCLKHVQMLKKIKSVDFSSFLEVQKEKLHYLKKAMEEFIRKSDYRNSREPISRIEGEGWKIMSKFLE